MANFKTKIQRFTPGQWFAVGLLLFSVFWILIGPNLLIQKGTSYDFSESGQIGDTIGGITAPIIGLVSAILVYLSFSAQIDANQIVREEGNFRYVLEEFERYKYNIEEKYENGFTLFEGMPPAKGFMALDIMQTRLNSKYVENRTDIEITNYSVRITIYYLKSFFIFINEVKKLKLSEEYKLTVEAKIGIYYEEFLSNYIDTFINLNIPERDPTLELKNYAEEIARIMDSFEKLK